VRLAEGAIRNAGKELISKFRNRSGFRGVSRVLQAAIKNKL
jgi:hypothetical protein